MHRRLEHRHAVAGGFAVALTLLLAACSSGAASAAPATPSAANPSAALASPGAGAGTAENGDSAGAAGNPAVAPGLVTTGPATGGSTGSTGSGVASSGSAIAYPCCGGTPGVAPDHTIVVTGYGQASMAADGSDRAKAQLKAIASAMADARSQADAIAQQASLTIIGVLSVNASSGGYGYAVPMPANGTSGVETPPTVTPGGPGLVPQPAPPFNGPVGFGMSVTVAYSVN